MSGPFYGKYRGVVTDNRDPLMLGRVRARVPDVFGQQRERLGSSQPALCGKGSGPLPDPACGRLGVDRVRAWRPGLSHLDRMFLVSGRAAGNACRGGDQGAEDRCRNHHHERPAGSRRHNHRDRVGHEDRDQRCRHRDK